MICFLSIRTPLWMDCSDEPAGGADVVDGKDGKNTVTYKDATDPVVVDLRSPDSNSYLKDGSPEAWIDGAASGSGHG